MNGVLPAAPSATAHAARPANAAAVDPAGDGAAPAPFAAALDNAYVQAGAADARGTPATARATRGASAERSTIPAGSDGPAAPDDKTDPSQASDSAAADLALWLPDWPPAAGTATPTAAAALPATAALPAAAALPATAAAPAGATVIAAADRPNPATAVVSAAAEDATAQPPGSLATVPARGAAAAAAAGTTTTANARTALAAELGSTPARPPASTSEVIAATQVDRSRPAEASPPALLAGAPGLATREAGMGAPGAAAPVAAPFEARLSAALDSAAFAPALATQIKWLVHEGVQHARLSLNPAEMGPLAVQIVLEGTQARIDFSAALGATRAAIEASLPTLAAALHDSGLTLAGGGVFDGAPRHGAQDERGARAPAVPEATTIAAPSATTTPMPPLRGARGLVDLVA